MAAKRRKVLEVFDFSEWALQDIVKVPLPSVDASDPPPSRWLGVQSLAHIATGRDGKVIVCDAAKRGVHFALGYVESYRKATHIVMPLDAPRAVMERPSLHRKAPLVGLLWGDDRRRRTKTDGVTGAASSSLGRESHPCRAATPVAPACSRNRASAE